MKNPETLQEMSEMARNREKFLDIFSKFIHRDGSSKLLEYLKKSSFFEDPASTKYHLAVAGGLCVHSLHVYSRLHTLLLNSKPPDNRQLTEAEEESVAIIGLLHDICKTGCYQPSYRNQKTYDADAVEAAEPWQRKHDELGDYVWESVAGFSFNDPFPYGHGEKSTMMVSAFMRLSREENLAIRWHMGFSDSDFKAGGKNVGNAFSLFPLVVLTHIADLEATYLDEVELDK